MPIPEEQLVTWSRQGDTASSRNTHLAIREALAASERLQLRDYDAFLQGSYRNHTNIRGDSDVDLCVKLNQTWGRDLAALPRTDRDLYLATYSKATYGWDEFRADVLDALKTSFPGQVTEAKKCLKIAAGPGRLPADVVVALEYRKYRRFRNEYDQDFVEGIKFYTLPDHREVINFPKPHYDHGVAKSPLTEGRFKPMVRVLKNARTLLVDGHLLSPEAGPSYFVECFAFNMPNESFLPRYTDTVQSFIATAGFLSTDAVMCQNLVTPLFGQTPEQWSQPQAEEFFRAMLELWSSWPA